MTQRLAAVAGEASGDLIGAQVLSRLLQQSPQIQVAGIGGAQLRAAGMQCWFDSEELAVRGYLEALSKLPRILWVRHQLLKRLRAWSPQVFLGIDAPDFNLGIEAKLRAQGVRTIHFISPAIWAWRPERLARIEQSVDHMLCVFPFEPDCYRGSQVKATYVGHPLADVIALAPESAPARRALGLATDGRAVVAVLPGSRLSEIRLNGPVFLQAAAVLAQDCQVVVPMASRAVSAALRSLPAYASAEQAGVQFVANDAIRGLALADGAQQRLPISHQALAACDVALVASGTATLETALFKRPMVIGYKVPAATYRLMARKALVKDIGLPNLLLGKRVVPEIIQQDMTPQALVQAIRDWLSHPARISAVADQFNQLHLALKRDAANQVADILARELQSGSAAGRLPTARVAAS